MTKAASNGGSSEPAVVAGQGAPQDEDEAEKKAETKLLEPQRTQRYLSEGEQLGLLSLSKPKSQAEGSTTSSIFLLVS